MNDNKFHLAYSVDNQDIAQQIDHQLSKVGIELDHIRINHARDEKQLQERLSTVPYFVFILVSKNFLKNVNCMNQSLFMLQELTMNNRVQPIIIDGREPVEGANSFKNVKTVFDRMTHVIQYMNFWQDRYLDLRKERRSTSISDLDKFDENLKIIRSISSEMGDFLKLLKNSNCWTFEKFTHNNYELFFQSIKKPALHAALKQAININEIPKVNSTIPNIITPPSTKPANENKDSLLNLNLKKDESERELATNDEKSIEEELSNKNLIKRIEDINDSKDIPSFQQELIQKDDTNLLKVSKDNIKKKNKAPTIDKLIEQRKIDFQIGDQSVKTTILPDENLNQNNSKLIDLMLLENDKKDEVFENADKKAIEKKNLDEDKLERKNHKSTKSNVPSHHILNEIFHDDDDELDSDDMIGSFTLSSIAKPESESIEKVNPTWQEQLEKGNELIKNGELNAGLKHLRELTEKNEDNQVLKYEYALNLLKSGENTASAQHELEKLLKLNPNHIGALVQLSEFASNKGDYALSKNYLEQAIDSDQKNADLLYKLGILLMTKFPDLQNQAANYLKLSIKIDNSITDAHYRYGLILVEHLKKPKKALRQFKITKKLQDNHKFVSYDLALLFHRIGKYKKAKKYYRQACKINPELKTKANDRAFLNALKSSKKNFDKETQEASNTSAKRKEKSKIKKNQPSKSINKLILPHEATSQNENFDKVVFISGATSGIGKATAAIFAQNGFRLILTGRRTDRLAEIKADFEENYPTEVQTLDFDVRKIAQAQTAIAGLPKGFNSIDLLINNAGLAKGFDPIHEGKLVDWETMIDTNVKGLLYLTRLISPRMVARKKGHIINVCSTAGHEVYPKGNVYCATKHAVDALTKGMRLDLYKYGLRVSQVSPAHVEETEFARVRFDWDEERAKIYEDFQPLRAEDVANTIYFIATQPAHVNIQDVLMMGRQQANSSNLDRSGR